MDKYKNYNIGFTGLKLGKHLFEFRTDQRFFDLFDVEQEFTNADIVSSVILEKHSSFLDFKISISGSVDLVCDISNKKFTYPINNTLNLLVNFGEEYDDSNDEIITIPHHYSEFNLAQIIYEGVVLSIPMKKYSPDVLETDEYQTLLEQFSPKIVEENDMDPRWATLNKLKNK